MIQIYSLIGQPSEANDYAAYSQDRFQAELASAVSAGESVVQVRLNSVGGNWLMAQAIFGMIKASALKIDTYCDGIAASSASLIFMAGRKRLISAHARLMIHNCSGAAAGQVADLEKAIEGQRAINESMATVYANATGQPVEKIREMMAAETWLSADEAVALGFATGIIDAPKTAAAPPADLTSSTAEAALLQLQAYYAGHLPTASPSPNMKNLLLPILTAHAVSGITASASDEQVTAAVSAAFTELGTARGQISTLTASLTETAGKVATAETARAEAEQKLKDFTDKQEAAEKEAGQQAIKDLVAGAVALGKITADLAPTYITLATADLPAATAALEKMPARKSVISTITASAAGADGVGRVTAAGAMAEISARTK
jgi:ATP-dependent Clp protease protease subunit